MLCCVGLFAGMAVGQSLGGPWTVAAPAAGFGIGFLADMKLMKRMHGQPSPAPAQAPRQAHESAPSPAPTPPDWGRAAQVATDDAGRT